MGAAIVSPISIAFSSEVGTGWREENASKQKLEEFHIAVVRVPAQTALRRGPGRGNFRFVY
jgi:hypothetical protein